MTTGANTRAPGQLIQENVTVRGGRVYRQRLLADAVPEEVVVTLALARVRALTTSSTFTQAPLPHRWRLRIAGVIDATPETT
jgi:hypothetical protein